MYRRSSQLIARGILRGSSKSIVPGCSMPKFYPTKLCHRHDSNIFGTISWSRAQQTVAGRSAENEPNPSVDKVRTIETKAQGYYDERSSTNCYNQGDIMHIGMHDLLKGEEAKLEGKARVDRAMELSTEVLLAKAFSQSGPPPSERMVMDMGSAKGDTARRAVRMYGCMVVCIDLSVKFNTVNAERTAVAGLSDKIIIPGERSYFNTGMKASSMDIVVSQDAFVHASTEHHSVVEEAARVLKPGGVFVFTDVMRSDYADEAKLAEVLKAEGVFDVTDLMRSDNADEAKVYKQQNVDALGSVESYKTWAHDNGLEFVEHNDYTINFAKHYASILDVMESMVMEGVNEGFLNRIRERYGAWVNAANDGLLTSGGFIFKKKKE